MELGATWNALLEVARFYASSLYLCKFQHHAGFAFLTMCAHMV